MQNPTTVTLANIKQILISGNNPVEKARVYGNDFDNEYRLLNYIKIKLSNGLLICIPIGYVWDLASVPRILWWLFPPDNDAELAFLIHDYLYENHRYLKITEEFANNELLRWSNATNGTEGRSLRNWDNTCRYLAVKWFGKRVWDKHN